jgi:hypothetical protein
MGRVIGNEIFKTIITMAYEMELAEKVLGRMAQRREKVRDLMRQGQTFRDSEDIRKEMAKYLAISHRNKKYWKYDEDNGGKGPGYALNKMIAMSVSGKYRIMLSIVKHTWREDDLKTVWDTFYIHLQDTDGWNVNNPNETPVPRNVGAPTVITVEILKQTALYREFAYDIQEAYEEIYERVSRRSGRNARTVWERQITMIRNADKHGILASMIRQRYGMKV